MSFGYPAVLAVNKDKLAFGAMKGSFNEKGFSTFLQDLLAGREKMAIMK
jgi:hypothetical protein